MSTVTEPSSIPDLPNQKTVQEKLSEEFSDWTKAKRSGDMSSQMRDARARMNALLDEFLMLKEYETPII